MHIFPRRLTVLYIHLDLEFKFKKYDRSVEVYFACQVSTSLKHLVSNFSAVT